MNDTINVKGLSDLGRFLSELAPKIAKNVARGAMRAAAKPVHQEARRLAPVAPPSRKNAKSYGAIAGALRKSLRVSVRLDGDRAVASVKAGGEVAYYAMWVERGTRPHFIRVDEKAKPGRMTRRGYRKLSIRTINRMVARGSLVIGGNFVGASVSHPGARPRPFMRPALDSKATAAVLAAGEYMKKRLATKHGLDTSDVDIAEVTE